jgi:phosphoserine aminotransferase
LIDRVHNFGAGPAALPLPVLEQVQAELLDFQGKGLSILEASHRSPLYDEVHQGTQASLRQLLGGEEATSGHRILFMGGGARSQFALVPMNLLPTGGSADYLVTGRWAEMALGEARRRGTAREIYSSAADGHDHVPAPGDYAVAPQAAYLHYTSNNTVAGTQFHEVPEAGDVPLVADMSSDILSRPLSLTSYGLIYAGAQKNLGPAGVTVVIVREDLLERSPADLPDTFSYAKMAAKDSLLNTPPVFAIYILGLVARHLIDRGGVEGAAERNRQKAALLYRTIDESDGFYQGHARRGSRSTMNVTFRLADPELEPKLLAEAADHGMLGLKGHRSVGGIRASIYNAVEMPSVEALVDFLGEFRRRNG